MATKKQVVASKKELTVVAIYKFKSNGKLNGTRCTLVRNDAGELYKVWTHANGCASSCECEGFTKWHKKCYHLKEVERIEAARKAAAVATPATPVVAESAPAAIKVISIESKQQVVKSDARTNRRETSSLNGPRPFSLPKSYAQLEQERQARKIS